MRHTQTHERAILVVAFALSTAVSAVYASSIFYAPLLGDLTILSNNTGSNPTTIQTTTTDDRNESSGVSGKTTTVTGSTEESDDDDPDEDDDGDRDSDERCILRMNRCSPSDPACLEAPIFIQGKCNDSRCTDGRAVCTKAIQTTGPSTAGSSTVRPDSSGQSPVIDTTRNDNSGPSGSPSTDSNGTSGSGRNESTPLGCYSANGTWTTDRSACAEDQSTFLPVLSTGERRPTGAQPFIENTSSSAPRDTGNTTVSPADQAQRTSIEDDRKDSSLQEAFREIFHPNEQPQPDALSGLLQTATDALERMQRLLNSPLSESTKITILQTHDWISALLSELTTNPQTDSQIGEKAVELKQRLEATTQAVATSLKPPTPRPTGVLGTLDRIFATLPSVFAFLQEQGAPVSRDAANAYLSAASVYGTTKTACLKTAGECAGLDRVISELETMRDEMKKTLEATGRTDLQERIDEMLQ